MQNQHTRELISARKTDVTQTQQQRPELPAVTLTWHASKYKAHKLHQRYTAYPVFMSEGVPVMEFMHLVFTSVSPSVGDSGLCYRCVCVTSFER